MVQIDVPIAFGAASLFADAASKQLSTGRAEYYFRTCAKNNLFQIFFFSWIPVYFLMNYFGWETTHMWWHADAVTAYPFYVPIFLVVFFGAANLGFLLGYALVKRGRLWTNRAIYLGILVYSGVWIFAQVERTFRLGTYREWQAGVAPWFYEDRTFLTMLIFTLAVWGIALAAFALQLRNEGRHLDANFKAGK
ncbi:MAG TPA: hypothetical protein VFA33_30420 [Bryobacteraceae bacterium]|nr:hypothetical protein [Bryobacteraceae bacterium]